MEEMFERAAVVFDIPLQLIRKGIMKFSRQLLTWYSKHKRDLPWRHTKDPYLIWLSEIILQQTRIEQGKPYYEKFMEAYPTVGHLAAADEQEVLKLWQGLGYYSRARNLHETARTIASENGGVFPGSYAGIRRLKGIGDYTAAAIASICFDLPYAVMDGNVMRFIARLHGIAESIDLPETKKKILAIANESMDLLKPGDFNQALMEFGATVCKPANPDCADCLFARNCFAFSNNKVDELPARKAKAIIRHRFLHFMVFTFSDLGTEFTYLNKRTGNDIWKNLYDFPYLECEPDKNEHYLPENEFGAMLQSTSAVLQDVSREYIHLLTHQKLHARFYRYHADQKVALPYLQVPLEDLHKYPVPRLIDRYISTLVSKPTP
jgi:A/G-specific adenine glycosylase